MDDLLKSAQEAPEAIMSGLVDSISKAAQVRVVIYTYTDAKISFSGRKNLFLHLGEN